MPEVAAGVLSLNPARTGASRTNTEFLVGVVVPELETRKFRQNNKTPTLRPIPLSGPPRQNFRGELCGPGRVAQLRVR